MKIQLSFKLFVFSFTLLRKCTKIGYRIVMSDGEY